MKQNTTTAIVATILATAAAAGAAYIITRPAVKEGVLVLPTPLPSPQAMPPEPQMPTDIASTAPAPSVPVPEVPAVSPTVPAGAGDIILIVVAAMIATGAVSLAALLRPGA